MRKMSLFVLSPYKDFSLQTIHLKVIEVALMLQAPAEFCIQGVCLSVYAVRLEGVCNDSE